MANVLPAEKRAMIAQALCEGMSMRATSRLVGCSKNTVAKLVKDLGEAVADYLDETLVGLPCERVQLDEIWSFCSVKQRIANKKGRENDPNCDDVWTWTAICADTKLVPVWLVGPRDAESARTVLDDLAGRLTKRAQISTDGLYIEPVENAFGANVDYGQVIKHYTEQPEGVKGRSSPARCKKIGKKAIEGAPSEAHISTPFAKRSNLEIRMRMRRFTRPTNEFSKKFENLAHSVAINFAAHNFIRPHGTLTKRRGGHPTTPAMAAGVATKAWRFEDLIGLIPSN